ncbi:MAG TPA: M48 family metallopeptidase [Chitinophagales bacterium]|nr:M48 family metallopeptidase [Chitinophagales bacterium]
MTRFDVTFYDGHSSRGVPALLSFEVMHWLIAADRGNGLVETLRWDIARIRRNETASGVNTFRFDSEPPQVIESRDPSIVRALREHYPREHFIDRKYAWLTSTGPAGIAALATVLIGLVALVYFVALPAAAGVLAGAMPRSTEIALGNSLFNAVTAEYKTDDSLTAHVNAYIKNIDFGTDYPIHVTVVQRDELNAFAFPGGRIVVYSKLIEEMNRHEELAALLSHEVAHVKHRHSLRALARNLSGYIFISLLIGDANAVMAVVVDNADMLNRLSFSRSLERHADEDAAQTMQKNNLDIGGMVDLFRTLNEAQGFDVGKFLSTHPLTDERIAYAKAQADRQERIVQNQTLEQIWNRIQASP